MADKELRHMSRSELIEIIYAVQQEEQTLQKENEDLKSQLEDRKIRVEEAGSIADAALSLNHIFEDAQSAADQYLESLQEQKEKQEAAAAEEEEQIQEARKKARRIVASARKQAEHIRQQGEQDVAEKEEKFQHNVKRILNQNPELAAAYRARAKREDDG